MGCSANVICSYKHSLRSSEEICLKNNLGLDKTFFLPEPYGVNFVPIFIKQIQCFANKQSALQRKTRLSNKRKVICKYKTLFERKC